MQVLFQALYAVHIMLCIICCACYACLSRRQSVSHVWSVAQQVLSMLGLMSWLRQAYCYVCNDTHMHLHYVLLLRPLYEHSHDISWLDQHAQRQLCHANTQKATG